MAWVNAMTAGTKTAILKIKMPLISVNRKAIFDYEILETYEAGIQLLGFEVKSAKAGHMNLAGSFAVIRNGEAWLVNAAIPPYQAKNTPPDYEPARSRRLLLKKTEIRELIGKTAQKGLTLIPLRVYTKGPKIKAAIGLARRRKKYDQRERIREREDERKMERALKHEL